MSSGHLHQLLQLLTATKIHLTAIQTTLLNYKMNTAFTVLALAFVASVNAGNLGLVRTVGVAPVVPVATAPVAYSHVYSHAAAPAAVVKTHTFAAPAVYTAPAIVRAPAILAPAPAIVRAAPAVLSAPVVPAVAATPVLV